MKKHKIKWTQETWNPVIGCNLCSLGCKNCYAEKMAVRLAGNPKTSYYKEVVKDGKWNGKLYLVQKHFDLPYTWKKPRLIFVNSMSDFFHTKFADSWHWDLFKTMNQNDHHIFQILTKRPENYQPYLDGCWGPNTWLGVTIETKYYMHRLVDLAYIPAEHKFISFEPLLSDVGTLNLKGIEWVIVGAESGQNRRECKLEWIINIQEQCENQNVPFFFKGWGNPSFENNELLEGIFYQQFPARMQKIIGG